MAGLGAGRKAPTSFPILLDEVPIAVKVINKHTGFGYFEKQAVKVTYNEKNYLWDPGYTKESMAPHMEYMGKPRDDCQALHTTFQSSLAMFWSDLNKKKRDAKGMQAIFEDFPRYVSELTGLYSKVGFRGRNESYAQMQLVLSLMKSKYKDECDKLMGEQSNGMRVYTEFLTVEPWITKVETLKKNYITLDGNSRKAVIGTFVKDADAGKLTGTPSFIIKYNQLKEGEGTGVEALERLTKWMEGDGAEIYEIQILFEGTTNESPDMIRQNLQKLCDNLKKSKTELFTLKGTTNIRADEKAGHRKFATSCVQGLIGSQDLQRICLEDCYIDFKTLEAMTGVTESSPITAIKMCNLKLGLTPPTEPTTIEVQTTGAGCDIHYCCCVEAGVCCPTYPDHVKTLSEITAEMDKFRQTNAELAGFHSGAGSLCKMFENMRRGGHVDIIDLTGTRLPDLCGSAEGLTKVMLAIAHSRPSAVCLNNTGLTDQHTTCLAQVFFNDPFVLHFEMGMCCTEQDGLEVMQNLVQNSPLIVSGGMYHNNPINVTVADQVIQQETGEETEGCFCGCCFGIPVKTYTLSQETHQYQFPGKAVEERDFEEFAAKFTDAVKEGLLIPMFSILRNIYQGNEKKLKKLELAAQDATYRECLAPAADLPKIELFKQFLKEVKSNTDANEMWHFPELAENGIGVQSAIQDITCKAQPSTAIAIGDAMEAPVQQLALDEVVEAAGENKI